MKRIVLWVFIASIFLNPVQSFALSCPKPSSVKSSYDEFDAVVIGKVKDIDSNDNKKMLEVEVKQSFKGVETEAITVYEDVTWGESQKNAEYLFFLNLKDGKWIHPLCSPTTHKTELAAEIYADKEEVVLQKVESSKSDSGNAIVIILMSLLITLAVMAAVWISMSRRNRT